MKLQMMIHLKQENTKLRFSHLMDKQHVYIHDHDSLRRPSRSQDAEQREQTVQSKPVDTTKVL